MMNSQELVNEEPENMVNSGCFHSMLGAERKVSLLRALVAEQGYEPSERGSEAFLDDLEEAVADVQKQVRSSNAQGLCLDCTVALACALQSS